MPPKRPLEVDLFTVPTNCSNKRRYLSAIPQTPASTSSFSFSSLSSTPVTPNTPYPSRPSDSPSNPFGRKRTRTLTRSLPAPSSFSKHLPLRFQLVHPSASPRLGGVHRIVQVPLSYTFTHLRCLIAFLFGGAGSSLCGPSDKHLFEVCRKVAMYSQTYRPGQIKTGQTWAKLSSARDPCRYRSESDEDTDELIGMHLSGEIEEGEGSKKKNWDVDDSGEEGDTEAEECEDWKWEPEEVFTVAHAWPQGGDLTRGIIYHHTRKMSIHVTINTAPIPRRKGTSNTPYIFSARGRVRLFPAPLPRPVFSVSPQDFHRGPFTIRSSTDARYRSLSPSTAQNDKRKQQTHSLAGEVDLDLTDADADGDTDPEYDCVEYRGEGQNHEPNSEEEEQQDSEREEDLTVNLSPDYWNVPDAFAMFLKKFGQATSFPSYTSSSEDEDEDNVERGAGSMHRSSTMASMPTPALTHSSSSSTAPPSSPLPFSSSSPSHVHQPTYALSSPYETLSSPSARFAKHTSRYAHTPYPAHAPWQRRRIDRVQRRMERMKRDKWLCAADEEDEGGKEEEKDELPDGEDQASGGCEGGKGSTQHVEVWDPFWDECEI